MEREEWRKIPGFSIYEASSLGRIRSIDRVDARNHQRRGCVLSQKTQARRMQYREVCLVEGGRLFHKAVHTLVAAAFLGPRPDKMWVAHNDGDPGNNRLDNLRYDTPSANLRDRERHGTAPWGERAGQSKLSAAQVAEIRRRARGGESGASIVRSGISSRTNVYRILRGESWAHTPEAA